MIVIGANEIINLVVAAFTAPETEFRLTSRDAVRSIRRRARLASEESSPDPALACIAELVIGLLSERYIDVSGAISEEEVATAKAGAALAVARRQADLMQLTLSNIGDDPETAEVLADILNGDGNRETLIGLLRRSVQPKALHETEQLSLLGSAYEPHPDIRGYVISALTGITDEQHEKLLQVCAVVKETLTRLGVKVHLPTEFTDPRQDGDRSPAAVHTVDYSAVARADVLVMIGDQPSSGAGKELVWGERNQCPVVVLTAPGSRVSRLVTGTTGDLKEIVWTADDDLSTQLERFITDRWVKLSAHARERARRPHVYGEAIEIANSRLELIAESLRTRPGATLTVARAQEISASANHYDGASVGELRSMALAAGMTLGEFMGDELLDRTPEMARLDATTLADRLDQRELAALRSAARDRGWDADTVIDLLGEATQMQASVLTRQRRRFRDAESWIDLRDG